MPHSSTSGVTNQIVDPDYIAPPGVSVEQAMDEGMPDQGQPDEAEPERKESTDAGRGPKPQGDTWDAGHPKPGNQNPAMDTPKKATAAPKKK